MKFSNVDDQRKSTIIRDQGDTTLTVALGKDLLVAICISYAFDRLRNTCTIEALIMGVALGLVGGFAYSYVT